jgi:hypothetical protein
MAVPVPEIMDQGGRKIYTKLGTSKVQNEFQTSNPRGRGKKKKMQAFMHTHAHSCIALKHEQLFPIMYNAKANSAFPLHIQCPY